MADELFDEALETRDLFDKTSADIPAGASLLKTVYNRAYVFLACGLIALAIFVVVAPQYWIGILVAAVLCVVVVLMSKNTPVIDVYEGFLVAHSSKDASKLCIIQNDELIYWTVDARYNSILQLFFVDVADPENALCATVHTINSYGATNLLRKYYADKQLSEIRRQVENRKFAQRREEARAERAVKREAKREEREAHKR